MNAPRLEIDLDRVTSGSFHIIIVGQNVQAAAADQRSEATYDDASAILVESQQIQAHLLAQDEQISALLEEVRALRAAG